MRGLLSRLGDEAGTSRHARDVQASIAEHLQVMLNTRSGEAAAAGDFGVVDFTELMHRFPSAVQALQQSIRATVLRYEPRLRAVSVRHVPDEDPLTVRFDITGQLGEGAGLVRLSTVMTPGGKFDVG